MPRFSRQETHDGHSRASTLELFYDLVFVFAITQVSHYLLEHLNWTGAGQSAVILLAVWWSWNYTTWATNELDTSAPPVRLLVIAVMLGSLLMSVAIPYAWGDRALLFAGAYVAIQVGRHLFLTFVSGTKGSNERGRASQILVWFCFSGIFWIGGALADQGTARTLLWLTALLIDYTAPMFVFRVPGMKRLRPEAWDLASEHFAERFQLFVIIALGESIVITGATTSELELTSETMLAFIVAFLGCAALWWLYFNRAADRMAGHLEDTVKRTELARDVYTYLHVFVIAGIIVSAVGDEILIHAPGEPLATNELIAMVGGPALYLLALSLTRLRSIGSLSPRRTVAAAACVAIGIIFAGASALVVALLVLAVLVIVIVAEELSPALPPVGSEANSS
jgi:low temperature requirement protein LtrA